MVDRVSTIGFFTRTVTDINRLQGSLAGLQQQISSGLKAQSFADLGSDVGRVLNLESDIASNTRYTRSNEIVVSRLKRMDVSIDGIEDVVTQLKSQLAIEISSSGSTNDITAFARNALDQVQNLLNVQDNARYLFSGGKITTAPVTGIRDNSNLSGTGASASVTANYYNGDDLVYSVNANDQLEISYGVNANNIAFQNVIGALHKAINAEAIGSDAERNAAFQAAVDLANEAVPQLATLRASVNSNILTLQDATNQLKQTNLQLNEFLGDRIEADVVGASIDVSLTEAVLSATLQTFSRITNLKLSDFLR